MPNSTNSPFKKRFTIVSRDDLAPIRKFIATAASQLGADSEHAGDLIVAVNEATTNIFEHGFNENNCQIEVTVTFDAGTLAVSLIDDAPEFDLTQAPSPDTTAPIEMRGNGGMGILMMREYTSNITYNRTAEAQNITTFEIGESYGNAS